MEVELGLRSVTSVPTLSALLGAEWRGRHGHRSLTATLENSLAPGDFPPASGEERRHLPWLVGPRRCSSPRPGPGPAAGSPETPPSHFCLSKSPQSSSMCLPKAGTAWLGLDSPQAACKPGRRSFECCLLQHSRTVNMGRRNDCPQTSQGPSLIHLSASLSPPAASPSPCPTTQASGELSLQAWPLLPGTPAMTHEESLEPPPAPTRIYPLIPCCADGADVLM